MQMKFLGAGLLSLLLAGGAAGAQTANDGRTSPVVVREVLGCRSLTDAGQRLACFDRAVAALGEAQSKGDLVTLDRQEVRNTRRSLFGLTLPNLRIFGDEDNSEEGSEIETTIVRAAAGPDGKWIFQLAEGGRWAQTDTRKFIVDPRAGQTIKIRRTALGSYTANVNDQRGIKVKRLN
nr:hypothetical protein [uncultured Sphingomonas sp.]